MKVTISKLIAFGILIFFNSRCNPSRIPVSSPDIPPSVQNLDQHRISFERWCKRMDKYELNIVDKKSDSFVALGIGQDENLKKARIAAELESKRNLTRCINICIEAATRYYIQEFTHKDTSIFKEIFEGYIFAKGKNNLDGSDIDTTTISIVKYGNDYYVAMVSMLNKEEHYNSFLKHYRFQEPNIMRRYMKEIDRRVRKYLKDK